MERIKELTEMTSDNGEIILEKLCGLFMCIVEKSKERKGGPEDTEFVVEEFDGNGGISLDMEGLLQQASRLKAKMERWGEADGKKKTL